MAVLFIFINMTSFSEFKDKALVGLFTFIVGMMWYDIKEMKQDIKTLVVSNTESKTRLDALERQVFKVTVYHGPIPFDYPPKETRNQQVAIMNRNEEDDDKTI